eukprot:5846477-Lingulodinium_polyedra.AAC.1
MAKAAKRQRPPTPSGATGQRRPQASGLADAGRPRAAVAAIPVRRRRRLCRPRTMSLRRRVGSNHLFVRSS